jgi:hypothetical protein
VRHAQGRASVDAVARRSRSLACWRQFMTCDPAA